MNGILAGITTALDALTGADHGAVAGLSAGELTALNDAYGLLRRRVDAGHAAIAAEIARQSRTELGRDGLARKAGFRSPAVMISATTGASMGTATKLMQVGEAVAPRTNLVGEELPPKHPALAVALREGQVGVEAVAEITRMLDRIAPRTDPAEAERMEGLLADAAPGLTSDQLRTLILRAEATLDPDGVEPREREQHANRSLVFREDRDGMTVLTARLDPETAAPVRTAIEGIVTAALRRNERTIGNTGASTGERTGEEETDGRVDDASQDDRSLTQRRADALADLCRHGIACETVPTGVTTTVVIRMSLEDLQNQTGHATIDGLSQPVSTSTARRIAADGQIIPYVLGGNSEILDWGRSKRLFTPAQKLALAERDGGCAFCGAPPSQTVAHHIRWWERDTGPTDLNNGILLCTTCHHRIHDDGWDIHIDGASTRATVLFIPPTWLDPTRTPRHGGRTRYDITA